MDQTCADSGVIKGNADQAEETFPVDSIPRDERAAGNEDALLPQHRALLEASAIATNVILEREYRTVTTKVELRRLGFAASQLRVPALLIPIWSVRGEIENYQARPDEPRIDSHRGRAIKYETVAGSRVILDVPPRIRKKLGDPTIPLWITEGSRKADSAVSHDLCCISISGVWNWRGSNSDGGKVALTDFESIALNERKVYVCFDSDLSEKREVRAALVRLKAFLESRGAEVLIIYIPPGESGAKVGLDDHFAAGGTVEDLLLHASDEVKGEPSLQEKQDPYPPYRLKDDGLYIVRQKASGEDIIEVENQLTNWFGRIVCDVIHDDGAERKVVHEIEAAVAGDEQHLKIFSVPASKLASLNWAIENLGSEAITFPLAWAREHALVALQLYSGKKPCRTIYGHTGWRTVDGARVYLHAGGAIGTKGPVEGIEVSLPTQLSGYSLPDPVADPVQVIRAALALLDLAPGSITVPLLATVFRAPLGTADYSLHLTGPTGEGKSELAALAQQFWGPSMHAKALPASWSSTGNSLESIAFAAKDAILTVDDFAPGGSVNDIQRMHREADRLLRAQGNRSGRSRMAGDGSLRPVRSPRGTVASTGEDVPRGASLRARLLILELSPGELDWTRLSTCQAEAAAGIYSQCLSTYIWYLANHVVHLDGLRDGVRLLRDEAVRGAEGHRRTAMIVADLAYGWKVFLQFAKEVGAITEDERAGFWVRAWAALGEAGARQAAHHKAADPVRRFIDLLVAAFVSGRAHLATPEGEVPQGDAEAWGWRARWSKDEDGQDNKVYFSQGNRVGWLEGGDVYLEPEAVLSAVQELAIRQGEALPVTGRTLRKRMAEQGLLVRTDAASESLLIRVSAEGAQRRVLHMRASLLRGKLSTHQEPSKPGKPPDAPSPDLLGLPGSKTDPANNPANGNSEETFTYKQLAGFAGSDDDTPSKEALAPSLSPSEGATSGPANPSRDPGSEGDDLLSGEDHAHGAMPAGTSDRSENPANPANDGGTSPNGPPPPWASDVEEVPF
jgi:hypothetical protein